MQVLFKSLHNVNSELSQKVLSEFNRFLSDKTVDLDDTAKLFSERIAEAINAKNSEDVFKPFEDDNLKIEGESASVGILDNLEIYSLLQLFLLYLKFNLKVLYKDGEGPKAVGLTRAAVPTKEAMKYTGNNKTDVEESVRGYSLLFS